VALKAELQRTHQGRETFKEQYMEMREINKELRRDFTKLERQVEEYWVRHEQSVYEQTMQTQRNKSRHRDPSYERLKGTIDLSDKENVLKTANMTSYMGMTTVQESQQEDKGFRKRQSMLSEIQAMIVDYKKKAQYNNLVAGLDGVSVDTD
jgi:hypothetical protein